ncbi:MAG TPA: hypothetical protein ENI63_00260 [Candidatus Kaiserbacteria bacterium]|nr:hypothetical protein [Candidatus Kaiserbacteria bacterium]
MSKNNRTADRVQAVWNILGGEQGVDRLLRHQVMVTESPRTWNDLGAICLSVTSYGTTGEEWIKRLEEENFHTSDYVKEKLLSPDFKPTNGVTTQIAVFRHKKFRNDNDLTKKEIRAEANKHDFTNCILEIACLIREKFTDEEIENLDIRWIVEMHEPTCSGGIPSPLIAYRNQDGRWRCVFSGLSVYYWWDTGFSLQLPSQVNAQ